MHSLVYISRPTIDDTNRAAGLGDIRAISTARNSALDVTGLLIAVPDYFAQLLEGPKAAIDDIMASILVDSRHCDIRLIRRSEAAFRRFPKWSMACFEGANVGEVAISPLLAQAYAGRDHEALRQLERLIDALADAIPAPKA